MFELAGFEDVGQVFALGLEGLESVLVGEEVDGVEVGGEGGVGGHESGRNGVGGHVEVLGAALLAGKEVGCWVLGGEKFVDDLDEG